MSAKILVIGCMLFAATADAKLSVGVGNAAAKRAEKTIDKARATVAASTNTTTSSVSSRLKWSVSIAETFDYSAPAIALDGTVYIGSSHHFVYYNTSWNLGPKAA